METLIFRQAFKRAKPSAPITGNWWLKANRVHLDTVLNRAPASVLLVLVLVLVLDDGRNFEDEDEDEEELSTVSSCASSELGAV